MSLHSGALNNVKLALIYTCYGANSPTSGTSILDAVDSKGSQCSVSWVGQTNIYYINAWNELFFEKVCNENETIVEGFRHADYWIDDECGTEAYTLMNGNRRERGDIYINL